MATNTNRPTISTLTPGGAFETGVGTTFASATGAAGQDGISVISAAITNGELTFMLSNGMTLGPFDVQGPMGNPGNNGDNGDDGLGWTGGSYDVNTGIVTFTSDDGLGFITGDIRGATGNPGTPGAEGAAAPTIINVSYDSGTELLTFTLSDGTTYDVTITAVMGPQGVEGPQGPQGVMGLQGPQGDTGDAGAAGPEGDSVDGVNIVSGGTVPGEDTVIQFTTDGSAVGPQITIQPGQQGVSGQAANLGDLTVPADAANPVLDTDITSVEYVTDEIADVTTLINAKQDANYVIADSSGLTDPNFDPDDFNRGTLVIQEDFGRLFFIDTSGEGDNFVKVTDIHLRNEIWEDDDSAGLAPSSPLYDFSTPSRIDNLESSVTDNTEDLGTLGTNLTNLTGRVSTNEGDITSLENTYVADTRIDLSSTETAATTNTDGNFDATANERHAARLISAVRVRELLDDAVGAIPAIPSELNDPASFDEGDVWYNETRDRIRYAINDTDTFTVAVESDDLITDIEGPVATADGGLQYTATRFDNTTISWTTQQGTTPTPGTAHFSADINPHTIVQTGAQADATVTVTLGVIGTGFSYQGFSSVTVVSDEDNGLSDTVTAPPSGSAASFSFTVDSSIESTITVNGNINYTDSNRDPQTHAFVLTTQVTSITPDHIYFDYAAAGTTTFNLSTFVDTGVVATDGAEFTITANDVDNGDLVIAYPSTLNPIGIFGPFGQYLPDPGEGLQSGITFTGGGSLSIYTLAGFEREGRLTFREL